MIGAYWPSGLVGSEGAMSGAALMDIGVEPGLGDFDSCVVPIRRLE
jgi:hypothetical protein